MRIAVVGAGYVGCVTAACLSRDGHAVVAVDNDPSKVQSLRDGICSVVEPGLQRARDEERPGGLPSSDGILRRCLCRCRFSDRLRERHLSATVSGYVEQLLPNVDDILMGIVDAAPLGSDAVVLCKTFQPTEQFLRTLGRSRLRSRAPARRPDCRCSGSFVKGA
jgi:threonine dehydrogenase-like Zn-dependent dehydrogenase